MTRLEKERQARAFLLLWWLVHDPETAKAFIAAVRQYSETLQTAWRVARLEAASDPFAAKRERAEN